MPKKNKKKRSVQAVDARQEDEDEDVHANGGEADESEGLVVVGTYDGALLGFRPSDGAQTFGYAPHVGCVKALMCNKLGRLASGATDTSVRLFDLVKGVEMGELQEHQETVASVDFAGTSNLVTGAADGQVCIWRCSDWELLLKFRAHKSGVTCLAAHPSGRLMASAGQDHSIRLWDLTRGTSAANISVDAVAEVLDWAPGGTHIAALSARHVVLVDTRSASLSSYREPVREGPVQVTLCAMCCLRDDVIMVGDDKGLVRALQASDSKVQEVCQLPTESQRRGRVKGIARGNADAKGIVFVVGLSQGLVEIWHLTNAQEVSGAFQKLHAVETGARLTCVVYWPGPSSATESIPIKDAAEDTQASNTTKRKKKQRKK